MTADLPPERPQIVQPGAPAIPAFAAFKAACVDGQITLRRDFANPIEFRRMPFNAREVLKYALATNIAGAGPPLRSTEVPQRIFRLNSTPESYLLLPSGGEATSFKNVCAVIVKGSFYGEATKVIFGSASEERPKHYGIPGTVIPYVSTFFGNYRASVARFEGWTIASTVPEVDPFGVSKE